VVFWYAGSMKKVIKIIIILIIIFAIYNRFKPLPEGISENWDIHNVPSEGVSFIYDETYVDLEGNRYVNQNIFDEVIRMVDNADKYILIDMFLFNDFQGNATEDTRDISKELTRALIDKNDEVEITFITDPINTIYGGLESDNLNKLRKEGINVVITDLTKLRDSNIVYSALWRPILRYLPVDFVSLPNPFSEKGESVNMTSYLKLLNFKANHRKLIVADDGDKMVSLITSANPHDGSSAHGNVAVKIKDYIWKDIIDSEIAVGNFSNIEVNEYKKDVEDKEGEVKVQLLTESKIRNSVIELISKSKTGDAIFLSMFYLSEKKIIRELIKASNKGVNIKVILDPNKDAFGREKNGIPNRVVANDLVENDIELRWCDTHGEQCHGKMIIFKTRDKTTMILGSANYTRRNLKDFNLESNVLVKGTRNEEVFLDAEEYFNRAWNNEENKVYTIEKEEYLEKSFIKKSLYNIMEISGLSSF